MSIEQTLERIAVALEAIAVNTSGTNVKTPPAPKAETPPAPPVKAETPPAPPVKAETPPPAPKAEKATPPPPPVKAETPPAPTMNAEQCNEALVAEYTRMGATPEAMSKIQTLMNDTYGVRSVNEMSASDYPALIAKVKELS